MGFCLVARKKGKLTKEEFSKLHSLPYAHGDFVKEKGEYTELHFFSISGTTFFRIPDIFLPRISWNIAEEGSRFLAPQEVKMLVERWEKISPEDLQRIRILDEKVYEGLKTIHGEPKDKAINERIAEIKNYRENPIYRIFKVASELSLEVAYEY